MKKKIILYGPKLNGNNKKSYGGGTGGYTRNMSVYLKYFKYLDFQIIPCFHTIRGELNLSFITKPVRLIIDVFSFLILLPKKNVKAVHILGQYRGAIIRETFIVLLAKIFRLHVLYEIKAGAFIKTYESSGNLYKKMIDFIIKNSEKILVEGKIYEEFIKKFYKKEASFFPNVVPSDEIPTKAHEKFKDNVLKIIFVGFAYEGKGIKELINGCNLFAKEENQVELTLVGQVDPEIENYLNTFLKSIFFKIDTKGKLKHSDVLLEFTKNDIYCYPTKHIGEGHNNTINEALMYGMVICATNAGFIGDFLNEENSYPINKLNAQEISKVFSNIITNTLLAKQKSEKGRQLVLHEFNTDIAKQKLQKHYEELCV